MTIKKIDFDEYEILQERSGRECWGEYPLLFYLFRRRADKTYWECRPLFNDEDMYYSGGPVEYVQVSLEYVKSHYPGLNL